MSSPMTLTTEKQLKDGDTLSSLSCFSHSGFGKPIYKSDSFPNKSIIYSGKARKTTNPASINAVP